jgi:hypothetical protein
VEFAMENSGNGKREKKERKKKERKKKEIRKKWLDPNRPSHGRS